VCHACKKSIGIEYFYSPTLNKDDEIFVYPLSSMQEEFREYSVIERIGGSSFLKQILKPVARAAV